MANLPYPDFNDAITGVNLFDTDSEFWEAMLTLQQTQEALPYRQRPALTPAAQQARASVIAAARVHQAAVNVRRHTVQSTIDRYLTPPTPPTDVRAGDVTWNTRSGRVIARSSRRPSPYSINNQDTPSYRMLDMRIWDDGANRVAEFPARNETVTMLARRSARPFTPTINPLGDFQWDKLAVPVSEVLKLEEMQRRVASIRTSVLGPLRKVVVARLPAQPVAPPVPTGRGNHCPVCLETYDNTEFMLSMDCGHITACIYCFYSLPILKPSRPEGLTLNLKEGLERGYFRIENDSVTVPDKACLLNCILCRKPTTQYVAFYPDSGK